MTAACEAHSCASRSLWIAGAVAPANRPLAQSRGRRRQSRRPSTRPTPPRSRSTCRIRGSRPSSSITCRRPTPFRRPLKFLGRIVGTPGELTYSKDINRYYEAIDKASDRIAMWNIGKTEEGRDMVVLAVADEATIKQIDKYKGMIAALTDPRKTTEAQAQQLIRTAKPIYWITSGMHSTENGGPEMLIELPYRLAVERDAVHPADPQQRHHDHHAGHRGRRP